MGRTKSAFYLSQALIVLLLSVGLASIVFNYQAALSLQLSPLILLVLFALVFIWANIKKSNLPILLLIYFFAMLAEGLGVAFGHPFGSYSYGQNLGPKLFSVPIIIGFNWLLLLLSSAAVVQKLPNSFIKIVLASALMTGMDFLLEPLAPVLDFWTFEGGQPSWYNYASWFALALCFHSLLFWKGVKLQNPIGAFIFGALALFFFGLFLHYF